MPPNWCAPRSAASSARSTALLIVMKGLPLAYSKDMQEDKEGAFDALDALSLAIRAMTGMVRDLVPDEARMKAAAGEGFATATDLADWLVRTLKMPFRDAHHVTGRIVGAAPRSRAWRWTSCRWRRCRRSSRGSRRGALKVLSVEASVKSRTSYGGTAPKNVMAQAKAGRSGWKKSENWAEAENFAAIAWLSGSRQSTAIFVWCGPHWGFRRDQ